MRVLTTANMATIAVSWHLRAVPLIEELPAEPIGRLPMSLSLAAREAALKVLLENGAFFSPPPALETIPKLAQRIEQLMRECRLQQPEARIELLALQTEIARSGSHFIELNLQYSFSRVHILDEMLDSLQTVTHLCCRQLNCDDDFLPHKEPQRLSSPELRHLLRSPLQAALSNAELLIEKSQYEQVSDQDLQEIVVCIREAVVVLAHRLS